MPGLVGFVSEITGSEATLKSMQDIITHQDFYVKDRCFIDHEICCTRSHINVIQKEPQPFENNGISVWLDGEFYNQAELVKHRNRNSDTCILNELYRNSPDFSFLKSIDGIYSAVIYDKPNHKLHLITDRYGLKHLYWSHINGQLAWASEVKAFLCLPWITPSINKKSVDDFFSIGYLLENRTWFNEVELLPSGTVLSYDLGTRRVESERYWWWDQIKTMEGDIDENEVAEELGRLFVEAVKRRCREGERVGLTLSGGLDSRAILAAMPEQKAPIHAITFGKKGCDDIRIAAIAAKVKGADHHVFEINQHNWLAPRIQGVWWTDGQFNLMHMHGIESRHIFKDYMDILLNGFLGDALLGGSYLGDKRFKIIEIYENRGRKFIAFGPKSLGIYLAVRLPFFDNQVIQLTMSIPESYRQNSKIYNRVLLEAFPALFESIPWQKTGYPISMHERKAALLTFSKKAKNKIVRVTSKCIGYRYHENGSYVNYNSWLRNEPAVSYFQSLLLNKDAIYPEYISKQKVGAELIDHLKGKQNYSDNLCRYLTFELWLQQTFNSQHRKWDEGNATREK